MKRITSVLFLIVWAALSIPSVVQAEDESVKQMALANDPGFQARVEYSLLKVVWAVMAETPGTEKHEQRIALAMQIRQSPQTWSALAARWLVMRGNIMAGTTTVGVGPPATATSTVTDAALFSQITADFNLWLDRDGL